MFASNRKSWFAGFVMAAALTAGVGQVRVASAAPKNEIAAVDHTDAGAVTQIRIRGTQAGKFSVYKLERPSRVVIDVAQADLSTAVTGAHESIATFATNSWAVSQVAAQELEDGGKVVRVVVTLARPGRYDVKAAGNDIIVTVTARDAAPETGTSAALSSARAEAADAVRAAATAQAEADRLREQAARNAERATKAEAAAAKASTTNASERHQLAKDLAAARAEESRAKAAATSAQAEAERARKTQADAERSVRIEAEQAVAVARSAASAAQAEADRLRRQAAADAARAAKADAAAATSSSANESERRAAAAALKTARAEATAAQASAAKAQADAERARTTQVEAERAMRAEAELAVASARQATKVAQAEADRLRVQAAADAARAERAEKAAGATGSASAAQRQAAAAELAEARADASRAKAAATAALADAERAKRSQSTAERDAERKAAVLVAAAEQDRSAAAADRAAAATMMKEVAAAQAAAQVRERAAAKAVADAERERTSARSAAERAAQARDAAAGTARSTALEAAASKAEARLQAAEAATAAAEAKRGEAERATATAQANAAQAETSRKAEEARATTAMQTRASAEAAAKTAQARAATAMEARTTAEAAAKAAQARAGAAMQAQVSAEAAAKAAQAQAERATKELADRTAAVERAAAQTAAKTAAATKAQADADAAVRANSSRQEIAAARAEAKRLGTERAQAEAALAAKQAAVASGQADVDKLARARSVAAADVARLTAETERLRAEQRTLVAASVAAPTASLVTIDDVGFRGDASQGEVSIRVPAAIVAQVVSSTSSRVELVLDGTALPTALERKLDVTRFGSPVRAVSSFRDRDQSGRVRVVVDLASATAPKVVRDGAFIKIKFGSVEQRPMQDLPSPVMGGYGASSTSVAQTSVAQVAPTRRKVYRGRIIDDIDFKDAPIHDLLRFLSDVGKVNIVVPDEINTGVTVRLSRVPWDQALEVILASKGLWYRKEGNIYRIAPRKEIDAEDEAAAARRASLREAEAPEVEILTLNYASASDLKAKLEPMLSPKGKVAVDERTNAIIISDIAEVRRKIKGLSLALDTQTPQISIEARIVEARSTFQRQFGIQWGGSALGSAAGGNATGLVFPSSIGLSGGADDSNLPTGGVAAPSNFAVNLPSTLAGAALGMSLGSVGGNFNINLRLSAMEESGTVRIISAPKITVLNNSQASISQGVSIPISVVGAAGTQTQFIPADLALTVTPYVSQRDCSIAMDIQVSKNEPDFVNTGARGDPTILRKEAKTKMLVADGETAVLGGIYTRNSGLSYSKVPFLGDLPVLGWLFKQRAENDERTEVLVFITPKITNRANLRCQ